MAGLEKFGLFGIKDSANLTFFSRKTGKPALYVDYANTFGVELSADAVYAMKKGAKAIKFDKATEGTIKMGMQMASTELMSFLMGTSLAEEVTKFHKREVYDISEADQQITLKATTIIADSVYVQKIRQDGVTSLGELTTATTTTNKVTCTGAKAGDKIAIYYLTEANANKFTVSANKLLNEEYKLVGITTARLYENGSDVPVELEFFKVAPQASVSLSFDSENPSSFDLTLDIMVDENNELFDWKEIPTV